MITTPPAAQRNTLSGPRPLPLLAVLLGLYAAQSIVASIVQSSLPVILREAGYSLTQIGLMSLFVLPWGLKIFWAPLVDRHGLPQQWILGCQLVLVALFLLASGFDATASPIIVAALLVVLVLAAATQDIATDALGIQSTRGGSRQIASGASTIGGYAGHLIGSGLWLWAFATQGWMIAMLLLALIAAVLTLPTLMAPRHTPAPALAPPAARPSLIRAMTSPLVLRGLLFLLVWHGGVRLSMSMTGAMLVDAGLSLEQIAWLRGAGGLGAGLLAAVTGMEVIRRFGLKPALWLAAATVVATCLGHATWALSPEAPTPLLIALHLGLLAATGLSFVAVYTVLMELCSPAQCATDFSVLQSFDVLILVAAGVLSGLLAQQLGFAILFLISAGLLCFALPLALPLAALSETTQSHEETP